MKGLAFIIFVLLAVVFGASHFVWAGYAIYMMVDGVGFWSSVGQCFFGWLVTTVVTGSISLVAYFKAVK